MQKSPCFFATQRIENKEVLASSQSPVIFCRKVPADRDTALDHKAFGKDSGLLASVDFSYSSQLHLNVSKEPQK